MNPEIEWVPVKYPPKVSDWYLCYEAGECQFEAVYRGGIWIDDAGHIRNPSHWRHCLPPPPFDPLTFGKTISVNDDESISNDKRKADLKELFEPIELKPVTFWKT